MNAASSSDSQVSVPSEGRPSSSLSISGASASGDRWAPFGFSRVIAERYLWSKRGEAFITIITVIAVLGVMIGVAVLTMAMAIMSGFEHELRSKIVGSSHIIVYQLGGEISGYQDVEKLIQEVPGVESVSPFVEQQVMMTQKGRARGILIRGINSDSAAGAEVDRYVEAAGGISLLEAKNSETAGGASVPNLPGVIVGRALARQLGLFTGQTVSLLLPKVGSTPFGLVPRYKRFRVAATYKSGLSGYEERLAYVALEDAQRFFKFGDEVTGFEIKIDRVEESPKVAAAIMDVFSRTPATRGLVAQDWTQSNKELWEALKMEKQVYFLVLLLLIVMASFSIITTLVMIVLEKRRDIAILMTLGASSKSIARIFHWQGAVIGALGVVGGVVLGVGGCIALQHYGFPLPEKVFPTSTVPVRLEGMNVVVVACSAFIICLLSTWYPSWRASRVEPGEALRYE